MTQRDAGAIDVVAVGANGELTARSRRPSSGSGPFGFAVTARDQLIVSEASGAAPNGAVSSYQLFGGATLSPIDRWSLELPLQDNPSLRSVTPADTLQYDLTEVGDAFLALEYRRPED